MGGGEDREEGVSYSEGKGKLRRREYEERAMGEVWGRRKMREKKLSQPFIPSSGEKVYV